MELDFKGIWRCRNGRKARVEELQHFNDPPQEGEEDERFSLWSGIIDPDGDDAWYQYWTLTGESMGENEIGRNKSSEWDLMERISERWSSERSGGENG